MKIKLVIPEISAVIRRQVEQAKGEVQRPLVEARAKNKELDTLQAALANAEGRLSANDRKALLDSEAAATVAAAEAQVKRLRPFIQQAARNLDQLLHAVAVTIYRVRRDVIRGNFADELFKQLREQLDFERLLKPYVHPRF